MNKIAYKLTQNDKIRIYFQNTVLNITLMKNRQKD